MLYYYKASLCKSDDDRIQENYEDDDEEDDDEDDDFLDPRMQQRWCSNPLFIASLQICLRPKMKTNITRELFQLVIMIMITRIMMITALPKRKTNIPERPFHHDHRNRRIYAFQSILPKAQNVDFLCCGAQSHHHSASSCFSIKCSSSQISNLCRTA